MCRALCIAALLLIGPLAPAAAQYSSYATLEGTVTDAETGEALPGAHVFIAESMMGTVTNEEGRFRLGRVPAGAHRLYASMLGYSAAARDTLLRANRTYTLALALEPTVLSAGEVTITAERDRRWRSRLQKFERYFLGTTSGADSTTILNPEVLHFDATWWGRLEAEAGIPLVIENRALGYRVQYFLKEFEASGGRIRWDGEPLFEELTPRDADEAVRWYRNRRRAYYGSFRHFMLALLSDRLRDEAFVVYQLPAAFESSMAQAYSRRRRVDPRRFLSEGETPAQHQFRFRGRLEITYLDEDPSRAFLRSPYRIADSQTSYIEVNDGPVTVDRHGEILEPYGLTFYGYFAFERVAELLPKEYRPNE